MFTRIYICFLAGGICEYHAFGHCYKVFDVAERYVDAENLCQSEGHQGYVIEVNSVEENEFVYNVLHGN